MVPSHTPGWVGQGQRWDPELMGVAFIARWTTTFVTLGGPSPRLNDFTVSLELSHQLDYCEATEADKHHTWPPGRVESMDPRALIYPGRHLWA